MKTQHNTLMLYDSDCLFCSRAVTFLLRHSDSGLKFTSINGEIGESWLRLLGEEARGPLLRTIFVIEETEILQRSDAVLALARHMKWPWRLLARLVQIIPLGLRDHAYDFVARNRYRFQRPRTSCQRPGQASGNRII